MTGDWVRVNQEAMEAEAKKIPLRLREGELLARSNNIKLLLI